MPIGPRAKEAVGVGARPTIPTARVMGPPGFGIVDAFPHISPQLKPRHRRRTALIDDLLVRRYIAAESAVRRRPKWACAA